MRELPDDYDLEQAFNDIMFLGEKVVGIQDSFGVLTEALRGFNQDISTWSEFMNTQMFQQSVIVSKNKKQFDYFKSSLQERWKQTFEKIESSFLKINQLFKIVRPDEGKHTYVYKYK